jgi:hypothetical protein
MNTVTDDTNTPPAEILNTYGFIITRHVNTEKTNEYWNNSIQCIRKLYPFRKIVIIDDNSDYNYVKAFYDYKNVEIIQSEFVGRGELLPYYYFHKYKFFKNAVIIHDSVFLHKRINFEKFSKIDVIPFWHFDADNENYMNSLRLTSNIKNRYLIDKHIIPDTNLMGMRFHNNWSGCFGVQCYINYNFLNYIVNKYSLFQLLNKVRNRADRCCLERIFGIIFSFESKTKIKSLLGNIHSYQNFDYTYDKYKKDLLVNKKLPKPIIKVWTGR